jgi:hypothetical protein
MCGMANVSIRSYSSKVTMCGGWGGSCLRNSTCTKGLRATNCLRSAKRNIPSQHPQIMVDRSWLHVLPQSVQHVFIYAHRVIVAQFGYNLAHL